jgi:membrane-associated phospholipid phosphatase
VAIGVQRPASVEPGVVTPERGYRFMDYSTQSYLGVVALIVLFFHNERLPHWPLLVAAHAAAILAIHALVLAHAKWPKSLLLTFVRITYPIIMIGTLYQETGWVNLLITGNYHDHAIIALEQMIFGYQPIVRFMEAFPYRPVAEVLYFAYFSYYSLVPGVMFALYFTDRRRCFRYVSVISFVFFVCYLAFMVAPVLGPKAILIPRYAEMVGINYVVPAVPPGVDAAFFYKIMSVIHGKWQVIGAAFPSSHVAVALGVLYFAWTSLRRARYAILIGVILLAISTVYCRYHYAVDVFGGIIFAAVFIPLGEWLYKRTS